MSARRRSYHHGNLKAALIEASLQLVREEGVEGLTVAEVGRRVGVSSAAPYKHFRDRAALLRALAAEANRLLNVAITAEVEGCGDPLEAFRRSGVAYVRWAAENPALFRLATDPAHLELDGSDEGLEAPPIEGLDTFWSDLAGMVRSGAALSGSDPVIAQLRGRALALGVATLFVSGTFEALGVGPEEAARVARAVLGEEVAPRG